MPRRSKLLLLIRMVVLCLCVSLFPSAGLAQTADDLFRNLWSNHLSLCGDLVSNPVSVDLERPVPDWVDELSIFASESREFSGATFASNDGDFFGFYDIWTTERFHKISCVVTFTRFPSSVLADMDSVAEGIRVLVEATPELEIGGDRLSRVSGPDNVSDFYHFLISGAFPDFPSMTITVLVSEGAISLETDISWMHEE